MGYEDDTVTNGVTYSYTISATNAAGESAQSGAVTATPQAAPLDFDDIANLGRWLDPSQEAYANNDSADPIHDATANHRNLLTNGIVATFKTGGVNSRPYYDLVSLNMYWNEIGSLSGTTLVFVFTMPSSASAWSLMTNNSGNGAFQLAGTAGADRPGSMGIYHTNRFDTPAYPEWMPGSNLHCIIVRSDASGYTVFIDGINQGKRPGAYNTNGSYGLWTPPNCRLYELGQYERGITDAEIAGLMATLSTRYSITLPSAALNNTEEGEISFEASPVLVGTAGWEMQGGFSNVYEPSVIQLGASSFIMSYTGGYTSSIPSIGIATSTDGISWTKNGSNPRIGNGNGGEASDAQRSNLVWNGGTNFDLYYSDEAGGGNIQRVSSTDSGANWGSKTLILSKAGAPTNFAGYANSFCLDEGGTRHMWVEAYRTNGSRFEIFYCSSSDGGTTFTGMVGPITAIQRGTDGSGMYGGPMVVKRGGTYHIYYHAALTGLTPTNLYHAFTDTPGTISSYVQIPNPVFYIGEQPSPISGADQLGDLCVIDLIGGGTRYWFEQVKNSNPENNIVSGLL